MANRFKVRTTVGADPVAATAVKVRTVAGGTPENALQLYVCTAVEETYPDGLGGPMVMKYTWALAEDFELPPKFMPAPTINKPIGFSGENDTWTHLQYAIAYPDDDRRKAMSKEIQYERNTGSGWFNIPDTYLVAAASQFHQVDWSVHPETSSNPNADYRARIRYLGIAGPGAYSDPSNSQTILTT